MIQRLDISVGRIMKTISDLGISDNTLVIFTSDNGPHDEGGHSVTRFNSSGGFQGYKRSLHEGGIRIPFIASWAGKIKPGISNHMGYFPDLLPTFCEMAGVKSDVQTDGISILDVLHGKDEKQKKHEYLYFEFLSQTAARKGKWKYFFDSEKKEEALYDIEKDRHEDSDIKNANQGIFSVMKEIVRKEHREHNPVNSPVFYDPLYHRPRG